MAGTVHTIRLLYAVYAATLLAVCGTGAVVAVATLSASSVGLVLAAGWIFAGIAWIVGGFLLAPSVATYLGPGGGVILWGAASTFGVTPSLRPIPSPEVLADVGEKLSRGTDLAALFAGLGVLLLVAGGLASVALWLGAAAGAAILAFVVVLMLVAKGHPAPPGPR